MKTKFTLLFLIMLAFSSCFVVNGHFARKNNSHIASVNNNVCKKLQGKVALYAIFVDSKYTNPWTSYDISSTIDSIGRAMDWVEKQAAKNGAGLNITLDFHQDDESIIPIEENLSKKTLSATLAPVNGVKSVDRWADKIGRTALKTFGPDSAVITKTKIKPYDRERLIAKLRDKHKTDNVALVYFINNYYKDELSCALHCESDKVPEYAIVSYKSPSVIAHEFLHLFGAWDLYRTYPRHRKLFLFNRESKILKEFPDEIMAFAYRDLDSLDISPITEYLVGWDNELDERYQKMLLGRKPKMLKY